MARKKLTLDDIFNDDDFGLLESKVQKSTVKTDDERLIDSFEEINLFIDKNEREPSNSSMSEYGLMAKLKNFRENEEQKKILKPYDRHNLLGHVDLPKATIDDILDDKDDFGLLNTDEDLSIFKYKHTPKPDKEKADFVAKRKPIKEKDFKKYEKMFFKVHKEIKEGRRKIISFQNAEKNLKVGQYYILDGILLYLESANLKREEIKIDSGDRVRTEGRTRTIFENGTYSNMLFRSLGKQILKNGKMITPSYEAMNNELFVNAGIVAEEDIETGWIYVLKSRSSNPEISRIKDLYKIGFSNTSVEERIKNAKNEATYLFSDVQLIATYKVYNRNANKLELLLHKFFAEACLDVDLYEQNGQRITPREWFVVPFEIIEETIQLILNENIVNYKYDPINKALKMK